MDSGRREKNSYVDLSSERRRKGKGNVAETQDSPVYHPQAFRNAANPLFSDENNGEEGEAVGVLLRKDDPLVGRRRWVSGESSRLRATGLLSSVDAGRSSTRRVVTHSGPLCGGRENGTQVAVIRETEGDPCATSMALFNTVQDDLTRMEARTVGEWGLSSDCEVAAAEGIAEVCPSSSDVEVDRVSDTFEHNEGTVRNSAEYVNSQLLIMAELLGVSWQGKLVDAKELFSRIAERWDSVMEGKETADRNQA